jgi:hypothetical protein
MSLGDQIVCVGGGAGRWVVALEAKELRGFSEDPMYGNGFVFPSVTTRPILCLMNDLQKAVYTLNLFPGLSLIL